MNRSRAAGSVLLLLLVAAIVGALQTGASAQTIAAAAARPNVELRFTVTDATGHHATARLSCRGTTYTARGYLRNRPAAACRTARRLASFLRSRPSSKGICTQQYGGPETARIRGTIGGRTIDRRFSRTDGCAIADWNRAGTLLPASTFAP